MKTKILITGSAGLIGRALSDILLAQGIEVSGLDIKASGAGRGDVRNAERVREAVRGCAGIVHLAAISRVAWGERDPKLCQDTNIGGLRNVLESAMAEELRPWLVFASSREVYGQLEELPAHEDSPQSPLNVYARAKVEGERLVEEAGQEGLRTSIIRLSNVYGSTLDHADRVIPAFARAALLGHPLRVDGHEHTFDFTHVDDVAQGIARLVGILQGGAPHIPPIHFVTGQPTTLGQLATLAIDIAGSRSAIQHAPPRTYDVSRFYGNPGRALELLDWTPGISLREGLARLITAFRAELTTGH